jgi:Protein of unknown function (DUF1329)
MKKWVISLLCLLIVPVLLFGGVAEAGKLKPIKGTGWHYPWKDTYANWNPGNLIFDEKLFNQDVIETYGWEGKSVDEIKDLIPQSMYIVMKSPDDWGPKKINLTAFIPPSGPLWDRFKEVTEKFKGQAKIDEKGWIENYTAGTPFPNPKNGLELFWNYKKRFSEDDRVFSVVTIITNRKGQVRYQTSDGNLIFFDGRLTDGDNHLYTPNPKNYARMDVYANAHPYEMQGTLSFIAQIDDPEKEDSFWLYLPALRRVRRLSAAQRTDRLPGGQDLMWENFDTFNGNAVNYNYKLLGKKEMIFVHNGNPRGEWIHGKHMVSPNEFYQKFEVYINEITPKDPNFPFSKILHYIDPETYMPYASEWFDKKGEPYIFSFFHNIPTESGVIVPMQMNHVDVQTIHSTGYCGTNPQFNIGLTPDYFKVDNLKKEYPSR